MHKYFNIFLAFLLFLSVSFNKAIAEEVLTWQDCIKEAEDRWSMEIKTGILRLKA